jgi:hypothetical protein
MTYPINSASPPPFDVGQVIQISDGAVQSAGVSVQVKTGTGSFSDGAGELVYDSTTGIWTYTPTQAETNAEMFIVQIYKAGCYSASINVSTDDGTANVTKIAGQPASASAPVAFPASVANETTVTSRATQTSVNAIPTNPLRDNDARVNFLDASIATSTSSVLGAISGLNNLSAKANLFGAAVLEAPETGSSIYEFTLVVNDDEGKLVNLDTAPTITATNSSGTNRSTNLSAITNPAVGRYRFTYTVASTHPREGLRIEANGTTSTEARYAIWAGAVVDFDQSTVLAQIVSDLALKPTLLQIDSGTMASNVTALTQRLTQARAGYLDGVLLAQNFNQRVVHVTGSHNIGADLRESQPNSIHPTTLETTVYNTLSANLLTTSHSSYTTPGTVGKTLTDTNTSLSTLLTRIPAATAQLVVDLATMLLGSNSPLVRWTAQALSLAPAGGGGGGGQTSVTPEAFINLDNKLLEKNTFVFFNNETRTYLVTLASGAFDGLPMTFCLERADKSTLTAVTGLTSTTNAVSVTVPSIAPQTDNCLHWSLRASATGKIILYGPAIQKYAAFNN